MCIHKGEGRREERLSLWISLLMHRRATVLDQFHLPLWHCNQHHHHHYHVRLLMEWEHGWMGSRRDHSPRSGVFLSGKKKEEIVRATVSNTNQDMEGKRRVGGTKRWEQRCTWWWRRPWNRKKKSEVFCPAQIAQKKKNLCLTLLLLLVWTVFLCQSFDLFFLLFSLSPNENL